MKAKELKALIVTRQRFQVLEVTLDSTLVEDKKLRGAVLDYRKACRAFDRVLKAAIARELADEKLVSEAAVNSQ